MKSFITPIVIYMIISIITLPNVAIGESHKNVVHDHLHPEDVSHVSVRLKGHKSVFMSILSDPYLRQQLDIRYIGAIDKNQAVHEENPQLQADIRADPNVLLDMINHVSTIKIHSSNHLRSRTRVYHHTGLELVYDELKDSFPAHDEVDVNDLKEMDYDKIAIAKDREEVAACRAKTHGYIKHLEKTSLATASPFFDCFRPFNEIKEFFDKLSDLHKEYMTPIPHVATTFEGIKIPGYKLSTTPKGLISKKQVLYTQALIHAREWQAGASTHYTMAALIDALQAKTKHVMNIFKHFDWIFVPVVNIDGYNYSWDVNRMWRANRDLNKQNFYYGVDLNRNFGPASYFHLDPSLDEKECEPGTKALSEPESAQIMKYLGKLHKEVGLAGVLDMHSFGGMVLRAFSDSKDAPEEPYGSLLKNMGDKIRDKLSHDSRNVTYESQPGAWLYTAYGCFDDAVTREFNYQVPSFTIEVEGNSFIAPCSSIRTVGENIYEGLVEFSEEALKYQVFLQDQ